MPQKKHKPEELVAKLRHTALLFDGLGICDIPARIASNPDVRLLCMPVEAFEHAEARANPLLSSMFHGPNDGKVSEAVNPVALHDGGVCTHSYGRRSVRDECPEQKWPIWLRTGRSGQGVKDRHGKLRRVSSRGLKLPT